MNQRERFDALRARYTAADEKVRSHQIDLRVKYGDAYQDSWLKAGERKQLEREVAARDKAGGSVLRVPVQHLSAGLAQRCADQLDLRAPVVRGCCAPAPPEALG